MMKLLANYQLDFMLVLSGMCVILILLLLFTGAIKRRRRFILILLVFNALMLISFDRMAYIYSGDVSTLGYVMVRVSNFVVFS